MNHQFLQYPMYHHYQQYHQNQKMLKYLMYHHFQKYLMYLHYQKNQLNGFWSRSAYYAFVSTFKFEAEKVSLDKYTIVEEQRQREVYNWLQYFTPETLGAEARAADLEVTEAYGNVAGAPYDADAAEFAVVLSKRG